MASATRSALCTVAGGGGLTKRRVPSGAGPDGRYAGTGRSVVGRRRWDRVDPGRGVRPDQEHRTWCVVDREPGRRPEALRPEPPPVTVAGDHEKVGAVGGRHDLTLDPAVPMLPAHRATDADSRGVQQRDLRLLVDPGDGVGRIGVGVTAAEQSGERAAGGFLDVAGRSRAAGRSPHPSGAYSAAASTQASHVPSTTHTTTRIALTLRSSTARPTVPELRRRERVGTVASRAGEIRRGGIACVFAGSVATAGSPASRRR